MIAVVGAAAQVAVGDVSLGIGFVRRGAREGGRKPYVTVFVVVVKVVEVLKAVRTWVSGTKTVEVTTAVGCRKVLQKELADTDRVLRIFSMVRVDQRSNAYGFLRARSTLSALQTEGVAQRREGGSPSISPLLISLATRLAVAGIEASKAARTVNEVFIVAIFLLFLVW